MARLKLLMRLWRRKVCQNVYMACVGMVALFIVIQVLNRESEQADNNMLPRWQHMVTNVTTHVSTTTTTRSLIHLDCQQLISANPTELRYAQRFLKLFTRKAVPNTDYKQLTKNCSTFIKDRGYMTTLGPTEEERNFPIAFSILGYQHVEQIDQLLRVMYRPQNLYCIHIDKNSRRDVQQGVQAIANCLTNVFLATKQEAIQYAGYTRLKADMNCMEDALKSDIKWKYLINLSAEMFPLKTNRELVKILKVYNGSNDIEGISPQYHSWRWRHRFEYQNGKMAETDKEKKPPPYQITLTKGSAYGAFSRAFLKYALYDPWARDLLDWMKDTYSPDEQFFPTLHNAKHNPQLNVPGSYKGDYTKNKWMVMYAHWYTDDNPCTGRNVRGICLPTVQDLPTLVQRREMFLNKLKPFEDDFIVAKCLAEWLLDRTANDAPFNLTDYQQLPFVRARLGQ